MHSLGKIKSGTCLALVISMAACGGSGGGGTNAVADKSDHLPVDKPASVDKPSPSPSPSPAPMPVEKPVAVEKPAPVVKPAPIKTPAAIEKPMAVKKPTVPVPVKPQNEIGSYDAFVDQEITMMTRYYNYGIEEKRNITKIENIPTNSSAIYKGVVGFGDDPNTTIASKANTDDIRLIDDNLRNSPTFTVENGKRVVVPSPPMLTGDITLKAEFSKNSFSGHIGKLKDYQNKDVAADINLHDGLIVANDFRTMDNNAISGTIEHNGELKEIYGGKFNGAFLGDHAEAVEGSIEIFRESERSPVRMTGGFVAEKEAQK